MTGSGGSSMTNLFTHHLRQGSEHIRLRKLSPPPTLCKFAFAMLLVGLAFALTYTESPNTFSAYDVKAILVLGAAVNVPLLVGSLFLLRRSKLIANAILSLVVLASVATAYIIHTDLYAAENRLDLITVCVAALFVLFVSFLVIDQQRWGGGTLSAVALIGLGTVLGGHFLERHGPLDVKTVLVLGAAVNVPLLIGSLLLFQRSKLIANTLLSLVILASGTTAAYIIHTGLYVAENRINLITVGVAAMFVFLVAFRAIDQQRRGGIMLSAVTLIGLGTVLGGQFLESHDPTTAITAAEAVEVDMSNIQHISFRAKPNLYFISFESLIPRSLLKKHYGTGTSPFHDLFEANFRRFPNFFSDDIYTLPSLNMILALDKEMFIKSNKEYRYSLFSGIQPSPLLNILRINGYETGSYYHSAYLGEHKGPYIDYYINREGSVCSLLDVTIRPIAFWGYCASLGEARRQSLARYFEYLEHFESLTANERPRFLMAHIEVPGHSANNFRYDDRAQRNAEIERYIQSLHNGTATRYLKAILEHVKNNDPNAILYVYGDHGPGISRGMSLEENPTFFIQDRLGVLGGVYPPDACATYLDETLSKGYMTTLDGVHAILRCLSGGQSALRTPREFPIILHEHISTRSYKEFLYE